MHAVCNVNKKERMNKWMQCMCEWGNVTERISSLSSFSPRVFGCWSPARLWFKLLFRWGLPAHCFVQRSERRWAVLFNESFVLQTVTFLSSPQIIRPHSSVNSTGELMLATCSFWTANLCLVRFRPRRIVPSREEWGNAAVFPRSVPLLLEFVMREARHPPLSFCAHW